VTTATRIGTSAGGAGGGAWTIVKTAGEATKKLYELSKQINDHTVRQQVDEELKQK
jgi:hypothetical protein